MCVFFILIYFTLNTSFINCTKKADPFSSTKSKFKLAFLNNPFNVHIYYRKFGTEKKKKILFKLILL